MMDAKKFLEEWQRMCKSYGNDCKGCPARDSDGWCTAEEVPCYRDVDNLLEMVEQWSREHPRKTRLDDLKEKYPNVLLTPYGLPYAVPCLLGYCQADRCSDCPHVDEWELKDCWGAEVEEND